MTSQPDSYRSSQSEFPYYLIWLGKYLISWGKLPKREKHTPCFYRFSHEIEITKKLGAAGKNIFFFGKPVERQGYDKSTCACYTKRQSYVDQQNYLSVHTNELWKEFVRKNCSLFNRCHNLYVTKVARTKAKNGSILIMNLIKLSYRLAAISTDKLNTCMFPTSRLDFVLKTARYPMQQEPS